MTIVQTEITEIATGEPLVIAWRVTRKSERFKVLDRTLGGVSLSQAQNEEIASAIQRNGGAVSTLNTMMRTNVAPMETAER